MKEFVRIIFPVFIATISLVIIANVQLGTTMECAETPKMDINRLFVKVKEDEFCSAISKAYGDKVKVTNWGDFTITCGNGLLIDDATKGAKDLELLINTAASRFACKKNGNTYTITLKKEDGYVDCPVMLITPILHVLKDKEIAQ